MTALAQITQRLAISNEIPREQDVNKTKDGGSRRAVLGALSHIVHNYTIKETVIKPTQKDIRKDKTKTDNIFHMLVIHEMTTLASFADQRKMHT